MKILTGILFAAALAAQEPVSPGLPPLVNWDAPTRVGILGSTKITLKEVIAKVLENNSDIAVSRILRNEAVLTLKGAKGAYDPVLGFKGQRSRAVTPVSSPLGGGVNGRLTNEEFLADPSLSGLMPALGGSYKLDFSSSKQMTDSTFATLNPQYPTSVNLSLTQPLWRGLMFDDNRYRLQVSKRNIDLSDEQLRQRITESVTQAVNAYWELENAYRNVEVQTEAVTLAATQDASNRRQVEQGILAPVDVVQTQTQLATFQQTLYAAQQQLTAAENALKTLMLPNRNDLMWGMSLVPDGSDVPQIDVPALDAAMKKALAERPEIKQSTLAVEISNLGVRRAKEAVKPQVDAYATVGLNGLAGVAAPQGTNAFTSAFVSLINSINSSLSSVGAAPIPPISFGGSGAPPNLVGTYGTSLDNLKSGQFSTAVVGVNIQLPIRNRAAEAQAAVAEGENHRYQTLQKQVEMAVEQDVRNAVQAVSSTQDRLSAAVRARQYAQTQYDSEVRQFQAGTSTVFLVLQRQTELITARTREVRARADVGEASANLDRALAGTLERYGISVR